MTHVMNTHNFSYNFLTCIKMFFVVVAFVVHEGMVALDILSWVTEEERLEKEAKGKQKFRDFRPVTTRN